MPEQAAFKCLRCGNEWRGEYDVESIERMCPKCRSNSVRRMKDKEPAEQDTRPQAKRGGSQ